MSTVLTHQVFAYQTLLPTLKETTESEQLFVANQTVIVERNAKRRSERNTEFLGGVSEDGTTAQIIQLPAKFTEIDV